MQIRKTEEVIDCTVDEYIKLVNAGAVKVKEEPKTQTKTKTQTKSIGKYPIKVRILKQGKNGSFSETEDLYIKKYAKRIGYDFLQECMPERKRTQLINRATYLKAKEKGLVGNKSKPGQKRTFKRFTKEDDDKIFSNIDKMSIEEIAKKHFKDRDEKSISDRYRYLKNKGKVPASAGASTPLPVIYPLNEENISLFKDVINDKLNKKSRKISLKDVNWIPLNKGLDWYKATWKMFLYNIVKQQGELSDYLGKNLKFSIKRERGEDILLFSYRK